MGHHVVVNVLRVLLIGAVLVIAVVQVVFLPWLSGEMARSLPGEAYMRWPILALAILGLLCVQVAIVCMLRLLGFTQDGRVFTPAAFRWVDGLIAAFIGAAAVCLATIVYQSQTVAGPPLWMLALACAFAVIFCKEIFGGTGMNIFNVAVGARMFLFFSYPLAMSGDKVWIAKDSIFGLATP